MIKQIFSLLLFFTLSLTLGLAQEPLNGFDDNGRRHGLWAKNFKDTDQLRYTGRFNHGKEVDTFKYYTLKEGKSVLSALRIFSEDSDLAQVRFYTSTGGLISKGQMRGKQYIGEWTYYHKNSEVVMITEHFNSKGLLDGEKKVYYKNGSLAEHSRYRDGQLHGEVSWYSEGGQLYKSLSYKNDQLDGPASYYESDGSLSSKGQYKANKKWGTWTYYKEGKAYKEIDYNSNTVKKLN
jgi:hypothetical protein